MQSIARAHWRALCAALALSLVWLPSARAVTSPSITVTDVTTAEGGSATFVVSLSEASSSTVTVRFQTVNGSATAPADYQPTSGTLSFAPGETSKTVTVRSDSDNVQEPDEVFYLQLSDATNAIIADPQGVGAIVDNDKTLAIQDSFVAEPEPGEVAYAIFQVLLSSPSSQTVTVRFSTEDGQAVAGEDYEPVSGTLTFRPGEASKTISVPVRTDGTAGSDEIFYVRLSKPSNAMLVRALGQASIVQSERVIAIGGNVVLEPPPGSEAVAIFNVSLSIPTSGSSGTVTGSPSSKPISVDFETVDGSAVAGEDYEPVHGTLVFQPGEGSKNLPVRVRNDGVFGYGETFYVRLFNPVNAKLSAPLAAASTVEADRTITIEDTTVTEGDSPGVYATFVVSMPLPTSEPMTFRYATSDGTAIAGQDYVAQSALLTFAPGEPSKTISIPIISDLVDEGDAPESFYVELSDLVGTRLQRPKATGIIVDDDRALSIKDTAVSEPDSETTDATFTVSLSSAAPREVQVGFETLDGTATAPADYQPTSGTLTIPAGELTATITVPVVGDLLEEPDETFSVRLSNPLNAKIAVGEATATIKASDTGYWLAAGDGGMFAFGDAPFLGSVGDQQLSHPIVGMAATPSGNGYWLVAADGGIFTFGDAPFLGSTGGIPLNHPVVGMAATPSGNGYWLAAADGGIFAFGDAPFLGSTGAMPLSHPVVGMAATLSGNGYWLVAADGGIFAFGDAAFLGSTGGVSLNRPIVGMAASPTGNGYWLAATDGGIFAFGDAQFVGSGGEMKLSRPIVGMAATPSGAGYWLAAGDGGVLAFGDAHFFGSAGTLTVGQSIVGIARLTGRSLPANGPP